MKPNRLTIAQVATRLKRRGESVQPLPYDLRRMTAMYHVTTASGDILTLTSAELAARYAKATTHN